MTADKLILESGWAYEYAVDVALRLEVLLKQHGVVIAPRSELEERVLKVLQLSDFQAQGRIDGDVREFFRNLIGVAELARLIIDAEKSPEFSTILPHLRLLNEGSAIQNARSSGRDSATNKLFELFVATLALTCGSKTELDNPIRSTGKNPDVLVSVKGKRWGVACKVLHGMNPEGFLDHLVKGIDQVEVSEATVGAVVFNLKNILPHDEFWPLEPTTDDGSGPRDGANVPFAFATPSEPYALLERWVAEFARSIRAHVPTGHLESLFAGKKCIPGLLFWSHTVSGIAVDGRRAVASVRAMNFFSLGVVEQADREFLESLNWAAFADSPSRDARATP